MTKAELAEDVTFRQMIDSITEYESDPHRFAKARWAVGTQAHSG